MAVSNCRENNLFFHCQVFEKKWKIYFLVKSRLYAHVRIGEGSYKWGITAVYDNPSLLSKLLKVRSGAFIRDFAVKQIHFQNVFRPPSRWILQDISPSSNSVDSWCVRKRQYGGRQPVDVSSRVRGCKVRMFKIFFRVFLLVNREFLSTGNF